MDDQVLLSSIAAHAKTNPETREGVEARLTLAAALEGCKEFAGEPRIVTNINGAHGFTPDFAAARMLKVARDTGSAQSALAWLRKVSVAVEVNGGAVSALHGVTCQDRVQFSDELVLLPYLDLPQSPTRDFVLGREKDPLFGIPRRPTAAFYRAGRINPLFVEQEKSLEELQPTLWYREIVDATRLLTLVPSTVPREAAHWMHYDDPDIELAGVQGLTQYVAEFDGLFSQPQLVSTELVRGLLPAYHALKLKDRDRIMLALERVDRARCQRHMGNRAIDLAIALEVLFMNADTGEHSYKISMRAARFLRDESEQRVRVFSHVRRLYDIRSKMVHTGQAPNEVTIDSTRISTYEIVQFVDRVCTDTIRKILLLGSIPIDWAGVELE